MITVRGVFVIWWAGWLTLSGYSQTLPAGFSQNLVANGISNPTVMAFAPDGRIFVAQQNGQLRVIKNNVLLSTPFVSLTVNSSGERGLIGIALDPDFETNGYVYLYYTTTTPRNRISRFTANGDVALAGSEVVVLDLDPLSSATNHNGGALAFGPDEKLYVAVGDNATGANAQNLDTYHGKILRINADGSVPAGNPFATGSEQRRRVWSYGLRNPYTFSFQPGTGKLYVNDVGQSTWEEINEATLPGLNFGWPTAEGNSTNPSFTNPVYAYAHGSGDGVGCAITGGTFFNPPVTNYPGSYYGRYFFLDYCNRWINSIPTDQAPAVRASFATTINGSPVSLETGPDGNLYYLSRGSGALYRIVYTNTSEPLITQHPQPQSIAEGGTATFEVQAVDSTPFSFQWYKNNSAIAGATGQTLTLTNVDGVDAALYHVVVTNVAGTATSNAALLTVIPINDFPVAEIVTPVHLSNYRAGTIISFSGQGMDNEDGDMPASAFTWRIRFHHDTHYHDQPDITGVKNGSFEVPNLGETSPDVWYRIILLVTDSEGLTGMDSVDVLPYTSMLTFQTEPAGLQILLDGQPLETPAVIESVEGMIRSLSVVSPQTLSDQEFSFESWSQGGDQTQQLVTPHEDAAYTATFTLVVGNEEKSSAHWDIFPNPVTLGSTLYFSSSHSGEGFLRITDFIGKTVGQKKFMRQSQAEPVPLSVEELPPGIYLVSWSVSGKTQVKKIAVR